MDKRAGRGAACCADNYPTTTSSWKVVGCSEDSRWALFGQCVEPVQVRTGKSHKGCQKGSHGSIRYNQLGPITSDGTETWVYLLRCMPLPCEAAVVQSKALQWFDIEFGSKRDDAMRVDLFVRVVVVFLDLCEMVS